MAGFFGAVRIGSDRIGSDRTRTATLGIGNNEGASILKVALIRAGNVTHSFDASQTYVELDIVSTTATTVTVRAPYTQSTAPPGDYLLFALKSPGPWQPLIPSIGRWTRR